MFGKNAPFSSNPIMGGLPCPYMYIGAESLERIDRSAATNQNIGKKCVAEMINTIDNEQSHKMRRYRHWLRDLREDCDELRATRESFRSELWSLRSV